MFRTLKARLTAAGATLALAAGGLSVMGASTATAATPPCGANCVSWFTQKYGPRFVVDVLGQHAVKDQEIILYQGSNSDPAEDFTYRFTGTVHSFYTQHHLVTAQFDHTYGADQAYEFEYSPDGVNSGYCLSTWPGMAPQDGFKVRLEPCGKFSNSLWAADAPNRVADHRSGGGFDYPLINGAADSFSDPEVMNYPSGYPTDQPRPWLSVNRESTYSNGAVFDNQQFGFKLGPLP